MRFTKLNVTGLLTSMIGLIYLFVVLYMLINDFDWAFGKPLIGIILFFAGGLITIIDSIMQSDIKTRRISSNLTLFYKYVISSIILSLLIFIIFMVFFSIVRHSDMIIAWILLFIISSVLLFPTIKALLRLKFVEFDSKHLVISDYKIAKKVGLEKIVKITRYWIYFYRIDLNNDSNTVQKVFIMPIITEVFMTFLISEPASIKELMDKIGK